MEICMRFVSLRHLAVLVLMAAAPAAYSQGGIPGYPDRVEAHDRRELALLPRYCLHTQVFRERLPAGQDRETEAWYARMGPTFHMMHHYCWGLMKSNRALMLARDPATRRFYLGDSINEFDWVLERAPVDFALLPEILTRKGENLIRLGSGPLGVPELERAIELKPNYWPAYAQLSDYYKDQRDFEKSREYLEKGLAHSPDVEALRTRLAALDAPRTQTKKPVQTTEKASPRKAIESEKPQVKGR